jgi:hypothetical protein
MHSIKTFSIVVLLGAAVSACGGSLRNEIEGNNTGGVIPPTLVSGGNAQSLANAHCGKWSATARITFSGADAGGDTIFVCETASGPTMMGAPATPPQAPAKQAPAKR